MKQCCVYALLYVCRGSLSFSASSSAFFILQSRRFRRFQCSTGKGVSRCRHACGVNAWTAGQYGCACSRSSLFSTTLLLLLLLFPASPREATRAPLANFPPESATTSTDLVVLVRFIDDKLARGSKWVPGPESGTPFCAPPQVFPKCVTDLNLVSART